MRLQGLLLTLATLLIAANSATPVFANSSKTFQLAGIITNSVTPPLSIQSSATDPLFSQQQSNLSRLRIPEAWDVTTGSPLAIAIIDTGIDLNNSEFTGRLWINSDEIPGNGIDDDHNSYIDDYNGYNFVDNNSTLLDGNGHGTGISSIVAANTNNGVGIAGINRSAKIMIVKALDSVGGGDFDDVIRGIRYAADNGARVINMSFGSPADEVELRSAIDYAIAHNVVIVAASGNAGTNQIYYPSAYPSVIAVGSVNSSNQRSSFSNYGAGLDVVAPGQGILMASPGGGFTQGDGSSFAAAEVTGVVSLLLAVYPSATPAQVTSLLQTTATHLGASVPSSDFGYGLPNAQALVGQANLNLTAQLSASPKTLVANGIEAATITATVFSQSGGIQSGVPVFAQLTGSGNIINNQVAGSSVSLGATNSLGQISFRVSSVVAETKQLSLNAGGAPIANSALSLIFKSTSPAVYKMKWLSQSPYPSLGIGQSTTVWVEVQNIGTVAWLANPSSGSDLGQTKLGTDRKMDRTSSFYTANSWLSTNRASYMQPSIVLPGSTARFEFSVTASPASVSGREYFRPVIERIAWLNDLGIYWDFNVVGTPGSSPISLNPADYQASVSFQSGGLTLSRNATGLLTVQLRNTGSATWSPLGTSTGAGRVKLGTSNPQDRASGFRTSNWLSSNRITDVGISVPPGGVLSLNFSVTAPSQTGDYKESFRLVSEFATWFGPELTWNLHVI